MNPSQQGLLGNGIGVAMLGYILQMDPATLQQVVGYLAALGFNISPVKATAIIALVGMVWNQYNTIKAHNAPPPLQPNQISNNQSGFFLPQFVTVMFVLCVAVTFLPGCASLSTGNSQQSKIVVQLGTMKAIEADKDHAGERALKVREIAKEAKTFLDGNDVSVSMLAGAVSARLAGIDLAPSDRVLAAALVDAVVSEIDVRVGEGLLSPDERMTVSQVLDWVIDATEFYAQ